MTSGGWNRLLPDMRVSKRPSARSKPGLAPTVHEPLRDEAHERAIEFRAEPGADGLRRSVSLPRFRLRALSHSGQVVLNLERQQRAGSARVAVDTLRMSLLGANPKANAVGLAPQTGVVSYFIGNDPKNWRSGIPTYGKVEYSQVYPGVDLVFYGNQRQLEYDFVVAPGADPGRIAWRIEGARASVDAEGNLALRTLQWPGRLQKPVLYQMDGDKRTSVEGSFAVAGNQVRFRLGTLRPFQGAGHRSRAQLRQLSCRERTPITSARRPDPASCKPARRRVSRWTARAARM